MTISQYCRRDALHLRRQAESTRDVEGANCFFWAPDQDDQNILLHIINGIRLF